mmetsp:Transcript_44894/g.136127  ORF Transcript_44894/g.136127 Transcript_44894/m.136127 type:complete len:206 (-) Transcript_44894:35-652(-)
MVALVLPILLQQSLARGAQVRVADQEARDFSLGGVPPLARRLEILEYDPMDFVVGAHRINLVAIKRNVLHIHRVAQGALPPADVAHRMHALPVNLRVGAHGVNHVALHGERSHLHLVADGAVPLAVRRQPSQHLLPDPLVLPHAVNEPIGDRDRAHWLGRVAQGAHPIGVRRHLHKQLLVHLLVHAHGVDERAVDRRMDHVALGP